MTKYNKNQFGYISERVNKKIEKWKEETLTDTEEDLLHIVLSSICLDHDIREYNIKRTTELIKKLAEERKQKRIKDLEEELKRLKGSDKNE